jgi:hypothetical protein
MGDNKTGAAQPFPELRGEIVVVDTDSAFTYLGRLVDLSAGFLKLDEVDVHETAKDGLSKERYVNEAREIGVRPNRKLTWVSLARVVSISRLQDVIAY